jgi:hypothetical protein
VSQPNAVPDGIAVIAGVPSLAGLVLFHFCFPGTYVPGFPVLPLRDWWIVRSTFLIDLKL